ncbi:NADH-quinone oxidoreductase subunit L [Ktedonobacter sp. SOSP1-52]|uniref:NADH-quinone oxidoreductase subunit L n=1 Tax=Ktedonobacter sp. SOSP1-52 TaxID=2778366 RepID=UPI001916AAB4|nr:NADH-quinone oxidoreductase subunit L [Ktedonobacter sp. SOSP1-52]GHO69165.1 NADH-quinone oxidoreductase subunit L [Ktedonobacter sp. SOSP1-52]
MINLSLWVLLPPLLGFIVLGLVGKVLPRAAILTVGWGACGLAFLFALSNFVSMLGTPANVAGGRVNDTVVYHWITSGTGSGAFNVDFGLLLDPLTATMLLVVTGVGLLIHIYSAGYMEDDPGFWRFFAYLNFFIFSMVLLVTADNFLFLLMGWGLVGLASFLLIGFWYQRSAPVAAARKAFVINVIGDFGLMLAIFLIFLNYGTLNFHDVFTNVNAVSTGSATAVAITLLIFVACAAKSAQLPLYMWLPDAMEGPTPVSALIHAATMVTAGVYLVARAHPLFQIAPVALNVVAGIGGATALFAATIALVQLDIKRVLAYSTISQLGYMFMAEGVYNYSAGIFHLLTHAFFKALLFLGAGAVIHALGGEQDMRNMGGLRSRLKITFWTFLFATWAISGLPPLAGFWSKDEILGGIFAQAVHTVNPGYYVLWGIGILTAGLTAFYMFRLFFSVFYGEYRGGAAVQSGHEDDEVEDLAPANHGHGHGAPASIYQVYEVPAVMWMPLAILAFLSIIGGVFGSFSLIGLPNWSPLGNFLAPVFSGVQTPEISLGLEWVSAGLSIAAALVGFFLARARYGQGFAYKESTSPVYKLLFNKYYVDEALGWLIVKPVQGVGRLATRFLDGSLLGGINTGITALFRGSSSGIRRLQTGYMRNYALAILFGVLLIVLYYAVRG